MQKNLHASQFITQEIFNANTFILKRDYSIINSDHRDTFIFLFNLHNIFSFVLTVDILH